MWKGTAETLKAKPTMVKATASEMIGTLPLLATASATPVSRVVPATP